MAKNLVEARRQIEPNVRTPHGKGKKGQLRVIGSLEWGGPASAPALCAALSARSAEVREAAAAALAGIGTSAVPPLCKALESRKPETRAAAVAVLGHLRDPRALEPLAAAFRRSFVGRSAKRQILLGV
ncbi:MAG TPA: HEAT repeat domain-containing protein, partial [Armatimonadota bacterium]|nr:HEAT repeat domain-containing protein [Armatimonadota bacterium]